MSIRHYLALLTFTLFCGLPLAAQTTEELSYLNILSVEVSGNQNVPEKLFMTEDLLLTKPGLELDPATLKIDSH